MIDPGLKADIRAEKPWTMSPLLCAMNVFNVTNLPANPTNIIPMTETKDSNNYSSVGPDSPISPASPNTFKIKKSLSLDVDFSDEYEDGPNLEENNTLLVSGQSMSADARKVFKRN